MASFLVFSVKKEQIIYPRDAEKAMGKRGIPGKKRRDGLGGGHCPRTGVRRPNIYLLLKKRLTSRRSGDIVLSESRISV